MFDRLPLLTLFALSLGCSPPPGTADETTGRFEAEARHSFLTDEAYGSNFRFGDCKFMTRFSDALADAGIDHHVEQDGSISYRSEDGDAVQLIGDELVYAYLADERQPSNDFSCREGAQSD